MTLLLIDGFDFADPVDVWTGGAAAGTVVTTEKRTGTRSYVMGAGQWLYRALQGGVDDDDGVTIGSAMRANTGSFGTFAHGHLFTEFDSGAGTSLHHIYSVLTQNRSIQIWRGSPGTAVGTLLAESAVNLWTLETWHYLETQVKIANSGGTVEVRLNGATVVTFTGDTRNGGAAGVVNRAGFLADGTGQQKFIDDIYILNEQGSAPDNTFLGDVRAWPLHPNGNGNYSQLLGSDANSTDNYLLVDEVGTPSIADYVGSATDGEKDTYTFEDLAASVGTIFGVELRMFAAKTEIGNKGIRAVIRRGSDVTGADFALATTAATYRELYALDPIAAAAWTITNVNSTEFGAEVRPI